MIELFISKGVRFPIPSSSYSNLFNSKNMDSLTGNQSKVFDKEEGFLLAVQLANGSLVHMVFKAAIELNLLEIMASAGPGKQLSAKDIAAQLPTQNPDAPGMLDRILRLLASYSILTCSQVYGDDDTVQWLYGLAPVCEYYVSNKHGISLSPYVLMIHYKSFIESCNYHLKDAILEGGTSFSKANGMQIFEYLGIDPRFNDLFNQSMVNVSIVLIKEMLEIYGGFDNAKVVVDVGGGLGENLSLITSKHPMIKGINFDLPHVIAAAPTYHGVEHVAGDMFSSVPKGDIIFMKHILHGCTDDQCLKLLKNCYEALPEDGKVVVVETLLPVVPETNLLAKNALRLDVLMLIQTGGKERTEKEYEALAKAAGFNGCKSDCRVLAYSIIEFYINM